MGTYVAKQMCTALEYCTYMCRTTTVPKQNNPRIQVSILNKAGRLGKDCFKKKVLGKRTICRAVRFYSTGVGIHGSRIGFFYGENLNAQYFLILRLRR
jgi:hypothetical protein